MSGALDAAFRIEGPLGQEHLTLEATGTDLSPGGPVEIGRMLRGTTRVTLEGTRNGQAFDIARAVVAGQRVNMTADGRLAIGASDLRATISLSDLGAARRGFGGTIGAEVTLRENGAERAVELQARATGLQAPNPALARLLAGTTLISGRAVQTPGTLLVQEARLANAGLSLAIDGQQRDGRPEMRVAAELRNIALVIPGIEGGARMTGTARDGGNAFALDLALTGPAGLNARIAGSLSKTLQADLRATGGLDIALVNPRIEPRSVQGPGQFDLGLNGPLLLSSVSGTAQVTGAQLVIPERNLRAQNMTAQAQIAGGQATISVVAPLTTGGTASVRGQVDLMPPLQADLTLTLDRARVIERQLFETLVSGQIDVRGALTQGPFLSGSVSLDQTEVRIPRVGLAQPGYIPPDIVHLDESVAARETRARAGIFRGESHGRIRRPARLDLQVDAPNRIFLRGRGLDAELGGTLRLTGTTADLVPIGQFGLIRGRLDVLGTRFTINEGFANLQGDLVPFVRLVASTERAGVTARIVLEGRADSPDIRFESIPELPEEEVVALLLFGRGLQNLSVFQAAQLASSLATLSGRSEGIMEKLRRNLGVDDLDVRTDEDGETSVRVGRYLTENVYTDIEVKPQGDSEVSINIDLTPSLTARGRVDNDGRTGIGLFFERDY